MLEPKKLTVWVMVKNFLMVSMTTMMVVTKKNREGKST